MEGIVDKIIRIIISTTNPRSEYGLNNRFEEENFLNGLCDDESINIDEVILKVLKTAKCKYKDFLFDENTLEIIEFVSLSIFDRFVYKKWIYLSDISKSRIRNKLLEISLEGCENSKEDLILINSSSSIRKLCCIFSKVIIYDYFASWRNFMENIFEHRNRIVNQINNNNLSNKCLESKILIRLTRIILGVTNEVSYSILNNLDCELNPKIRASVKIGICNEIEPVIYLISDELQKSINTETGTFNCIDNSVIKLSLDCLKYLANIIDSGKLLHLKLDKLLIKLQNNELIESDEEILDLFASLLNNLTKQKKNRVFMIEHEDLNRFVIEVSNLIINIVFNNQAIKNNLEYEVYSKHLNWVKLFKDIIEGCFLAIIEFPDNIIFENSKNKFDTIAYIWNICLLFCTHPYISICDLSVSAMNFILKILPKKIEYYLKPDCKYNLQNFYFETLIVILYIRLLRIGDPTINYLNNEWSFWNNMIFIMLHDSTNKIDSEIFKMNALLSNQSINFSHITSSYFKSINEYNLVDMNRDYHEIFNYSCKDIPLSFNNSYGCLRNRIIHLLNSLVDLGEGIILNQIFETILNISTFLLSSQPFNEICTHQHSYINQRFENYKYNLSIDSININNVCQKWIFIDSIFLICETLLNRILQNLNNGNEFDLNFIVKMDNSYSSYLDLFVDKIEFRESKKWIFSLYKFLNGILQFSLKELCSYHLESRRLNFICNSSMCIEWYQKLYINHNKFITPNGYLNTFFFYIVNNNFRNHELFKISSHFLSKMLLNYPKIFLPYSFEIIETTNQVLNNSKLSFEERNVLTSTLIAATNATEKFSKISELSIMASKPAIEFLSNPNFQNSSDLEEKVLNFFFDSLVKSTCSNIEIDDSNWSNLLMLKNSLFLLNSIVSNINIPDKFESAKEGKFINQDNQLYFKHPFDPVSKPILETVSMLSQIFFRISSFDRKTKNENLNFISIFNSISDQEWIARSGIKNINDNQILKLAQLTSFKFISNNNIIFIRRLTFSIRCIMIKLITSLFTLGTEKEVQMLEETQNSDMIITAKGLYFNEEAINCLIKALICPIETSPIHLVYYILKYGWTKILSPWTIPRACIGNPTILFMEEIFSKRLIPVLIRKLNMEWKNLMISQAFILRNSANEIHFKNSEILPEDPFKLLFNVEFNFEELPHELQDQSLYNVIYISHYSDLSEISLLTLKIVDQFISSNKNKYKSKNSYKFHNKDLSIYEKIQDQKKSKVQSKNYVFSSIIFTNQVLLTTCLNVVIEFLNFPEPNIIETSLHIIQKYLQQYINLINMNNHFKYCELHIFIIKNLFIQLLKISAKYFPFDPLNLSLSESNVDISTPLNSYLKFKHFNILKNVIMDIINCIIRSESECLNFIFKMKNELSKENTSDYKMQLTAHKNLDIFEIPENIIIKAFNSLEFIHTRETEYNNCNIKLISRQDLALVCKLFLQEYILDIISSNSLFSNAVETILINLSKISEVINVNQNPYINFNTSLKTIIVEQDYLRK